MSSGTISSNLHPIVFKCRGERDAAEVSNQMIREESNLDIPQQSLEKQCHIRTPRRPLQSELH